MSSSVRQTLPSASQPPPGPRVPAPRRAGRPARRSAARLADTAVDLLGRLAVRPPPARRRRRRARRPIGHPRRLKDRLADLEQPPRRFDGGLGVLGAVVADHDRPGRGRLRRAAARSARADAAWPSTPEETLPSSALLTRPSPREPTTTAAAPCCSASASSVGHAFGLPRRADGDRLEAGRLCQLGAAGGDALGLAPRPRSRAPRAASFIVPVRWSTSVVKQQLGQRIPHVGHNGAPRREQLGRAANRVLGLFGAVVSDQDRAAAVLHGRQARTLRRQALAPSRRLDPRLMALGSARNCEPGKGLGLPR